MSHPTINISLDQQERKELAERIRKTHERKMADRLRVILYKATGYTNQAIAQLLQMGRNHVAALLQRYRDGGLAAVLQPDHYKGSAPRLTVEQQQVLKIELTTHIYVTAWQVIAWIDAQWHVQYAVSAVHKLLNQDFPVLRYDLLHLHCFHLSLPPHQSRRPA